MYIHDNYYNTCIIVDITVKKKLQVQNIILTYCKLPGGYSREFWIGVCREGSWTLTLFKD